MIDKVTLDNGLTFKLTKENHNAKIIYSPKAMGVILVPRSITIQSQEYLITEIDEKSFKNNKLIKQLKFTEDSALISIKKKSFINSHIEHLTIPPSVEELQEGWCDYTSKLTITVSPNNPHFKYLDESNSILLGKSDKNSEEFDVIKFANRSIKHAKIPSNIKHIDSFSFENCCYLEKVEIPENSELRSFGKKVFANTLTSNVYIPSKVEKIQEGFVEDSTPPDLIIISPQNRFFKFFDESHHIVVKSDKNNDTILIGNHNLTIVKLTPNITRIATNAFCSCPCLYKIEIPENSRLRSIGKYSFYETLIEELYIPESLEELKEGWCNETKQLFRVKISPKNRHFKFADEKNQIILGKSDNNSDDFDVIKFASRDIKYAQIPSNIKHIDSYSFENCSNLETIEFPKNTQLKTIGKFSFSSTGIKKLIIPKSVEKIRYYCFSFCEKLEEVEIEKGSKLLSFSEGLFNFCTELKTIEIPEESSIQIFGKKIFNQTQISKVYIPSSVHTLKEGWCNSTDALITVEISPKNKHIKYGDEKHQIILTKSDNDIENFDVVNFAVRSIDGEIEIPKNIKYINSCAFEYCTKLNSVKLNNCEQLKLINKKAFHLTNISSIYIPQNLEELYKWCSGVKKLIEVKISPKNRHFKFADENNQIILGKSDNNSDDFDVIKFANRDIKYAQIPSNIKHIDSYSFEYCSDLETIEFPKNTQLKTIDRFSFSSTGIKKFVLPKSVEQIQKFTFSFCRDLDEFEIEKGSKLIELPSFSFYYCESLNTIKIHEDSNLLVIEYFAFNNSSIKSFYIPTNARILKNGFSLYSSLESINISPQHKSIKFIDEENKIIVCKNGSDSKNYESIAFADRSIKKAIIPESIKFIAIYAFGNCENLKTIEFPENSELMFIGSNAFDSSSIRGLILPKSYHVVMNGAFNSMKSLISIEFLTEHINIDPDSFSDDENLRVLSFPNIHEFTFNENICSYIEGASLFINPGAKIHII